MAGFAKQHGGQECEAYTSFCGVLDNIRERYAELNPKTGAVCGTDKRGPLASYDGPPSETAMEYIRGGIVSTMAAWEAYVHDVLEEAFERVMELGNNDLTTLKKRWPQCETVIQDAFEKKTLGDHGDKKKPAKKLAFDLMEKNNPWKFLLEEERDHHLKQLQVPLFAGPNGIDKTFEKMLAVKEKEKEKDKDSLSKRVVNFGGVCYKFRYSPISTGEAQVEIRDEKTLNNILRLYYGLRCVFAHGQHDKTFKRGGSLDKFPEDLKITKEANTKLVQLYERVRDHGREAHVNYFILVNMNRFIFRIARLLFLAIAEWFYEKFEIVIWGYDPKCKVPLNDGDDDD